MISDAPNDCSFWSRRIVSPPTRSQRPENITSQFSELQSRASGGPITRDLESSASPAADNRGSSLQTSPAGGFHPPAHGGENKAPEPRTGTAQTQRGKSTPGPT